MGVMLLCYKLIEMGTKMGSVTVIAVLGGVFISFSIGSFFSITYVVPTNLAQLELAKSGKSVASMYFAVQGLFEGIAAGIATGPILTLLKDKDVIYLLPVVVIAACVIALVMSFFFPKEIRYMSKNVEMKQESKA